MKGAIQIKFIIIIIIIIIIIGARSLDFLTRWLLAVWEACRALGPDEPLAPWGRWPPEKPPPPPPSWLLGWALGRGWAWLLGWAMGSLFLGTAPGTEQSTAGGGGGLIKTHAESLMTTQ